MLCRVLDTNLEGIQDNFSKLKVGERFALRSTGFGREELVKGEIQ